MIKSLRGRLTAWYLGLFTLLFLLLAVFLYGALARQMEHRLDESLTVEANTAGALLEDEFVEMKGNAQVAASEVLADLRLSGSTVAILAPRRLLGSSAQVPPEQTAEILRLAAGVPGRILIFGVSGGKHGARVAVRRVALDRQEHLVAAIAPRDSVVEDLATVRSVLMLGLPLFLILAGGGGYWIAHRNLAPLASMAGQTRLISHSNLDARLEIGQAAEELSMVAESFNELLARLDQSFDQMRRFVADASHELRTPLSIIRGEADVSLSQARSPAEYQQTLAIILDESRSLSLLIDDLLNLARADAGRFQLHTQEFYLDDLIAECCRSIPSHGVIVECQCPHDVSILGDEELIRRMIVNLIENAIRYTPAGGRVTASLTRNQQTVEIQIRDTGTGIEPEALSHVFERFYRADKARSRQDGGFGLGLSIVQWIAGAHKGTVKVESSIGKGSAFTVTLPTTLRSVARRMGHPDS